MARRQQRRDDSGRSLFRSLMESGVSIAYVASVLRSDPDALIVNYTLGFTPKQTHLLGKLVAGVSLHRLPPKAYLGERDCEAACIE
jgi:hypothetical protein